MNVKDTSNPARLTHGIRDQCQGHDFQSLTTAGRAAQPPPLQPRPRGEPHGVERAPYGGEKCWKAHTEAKESRASKGANFKHGGSENFFAS